MLKVAIVDDGICDEMLNDVVGISHYQVLNGCVIKKKCREQRKITHGTICALALLTVETNVEIIDIKAFSKMEASVEDILEALHFCIRQNVSVINMSFGTVNFLDYKKMESVILQLQEKNIYLVSAFSNLSIISFPAACKGVFGVRRDIWNKLENGQFGFHLQRGFSPENCLVAHYDIEQINALSNMKNGNSFAAPVISGWILKFLQNSNNATYDYILSELINREKSRWCRGNSIRKKYYVGKYTVMTPVIGIRYSNPVLFNIIKNFFLDNSYYIIVITEISNVENEIPVGLYLSKREKVSRSFIYTLEENYKADAILLYLNKDRYAVKDIWSCLDIIFDQKGKEVTVKNDKKIQENICISEVNNYIRDFYLQKRD